MKKAISDQLLTLVAQAELDDQEIWIANRQVFRAGYEAGRQMVYYSQLRNAILMLEDRTNSPKEPEANERSKEDGRQGGDEGSGTEGEKGKVES